MWHFSGILQSVDKSPESYLLQLEGVDLRSIPYFIYEESKQFLFPIESLVQYKYI